MIQTFKRLALATTAILAVSMLYPLPALSQKQNREAAQQFFRAGERAYNAGQYVVAAQAFEEAYETLPLAAIAFSAAQSYRLQFFIDTDPSRLKRSIELYRLYIREVSSGGRRNDAVTGLSELQPILDRMEAQQREEGKGPIRSRPTTKLETRLMVSSQITGARASIDNGEAIAMPIVTQVKPGEHNLLFSAEGYFPVTKTVVAVEGQLLPVEATLKPKPALLHLKTEADADVSVDGRPMGQSPFARPIELTKGNHIISVRANGRRAWSRDIEVTRGQELKLDASLRTTTQRKISYWVMGTSALSFAASGIFAGAAWKSDSAADKLLDRTKTETLSQSELQSYNAHRAARDERRRSAFVFAGVGAGFAAGAILLYLLDTPTAEFTPRSSDASSESPSIVPLVDSDMTGVGYSRVF